MGPRRRPPTPRFDSASCRRRAVASDRPAGAGTRHADGPDHLGGGLRLDLAGASLSVAHDLDLRRARGWASEVAGQSIDGGIVRHGRRPVRPADGSGSRGRDGTNPCCSRAEPGHPDRRSGGIVRRPESIRLARPSPSPNGAEPGLARRPKRPPSPPRTRPRSPGSAWAPASSSGPTPRSRFPPRQRPTKSPRKQIRQRMRSHQ